METRPPSISPGASPPAPGRFRLGQAAVWLAAMLLLGAAGARTAWGIERFFAPIVFFPLLVGAVLGLLMVVLMRTLQVGHRPTVAAGAVLAGLVTVVGQHYLSYHEARRQAEASAASRVAASLFPERAPAESFLQFMGREARDGRRLGWFRATGALAWLSWGLDAACVLLPATLLVIAAARLPYCNRCRTWYRTVCGRRVDRATATALGAVLGIRCPGDTEKVRFRLIECSAGCSPAGAAMSWTDPTGGQSSGYLWLDPDRRRHVREILDQASPTDPDEPAESGEGPAVLSS